MVRLVRAALPLLLLLFLAGCSGTGSLPGKLALPWANASQGIAYTVVVEGKGLSSALADRLRDVLETARTDLPPPPNRVVLLRQGEADLERLRAALRADGYYAASASVRLEEVEREAAAAGTGTVLPGEDEETAPAAVPSPRYRLVFEVEPGPRYRFGKRRIRIIGPAYGFEPPSPGRLGLKDGDPALAERILSAEAQLLRTAKREGHAMARLGKRRVVVDHTTRLVEVELAIEPGPVFAFGPIRFEGAEDVDRIFLLRRVRFATGDRFDPRLVARARRLLVTSGLFTAVRAKVAEEPDANGTIPVTFELVPRRPRSIGGAVGIHSDRGPGGRIFFQHRNLFGGGENLRMEGRTSRDLVAGRIQLRVPEFLRPAQDLVTFAAYSDETSNAFRSRSVTFGSGIERELGTHLKVGYGLRYRFADIRDKTLKGTGRNDTFRLISLPISVTYDRRDSLFDPTQGTRIVVAVDPFQDTSDAAIRFLRARYSQTLYFKLQRQPRLVLALRGVAGTILGVERVDIPADERFYAGGGGSIRGIPFQKAGPLNSDNDPLGGRSLVEGSVELRFRPFEKLGFAAFLDGGSAFTAVIPDLEEETPRFGVGFGVRYATPIGPLRLDLAVPLKRNEDVDDPFQLYISLGQAF